MTILALSPSRHVAHKLIKQPLSNGINFSAIFAYIKLAYCSNYKLPSKHLSLNNTLCSNRNFSINSLEEKLISRDTALHFNIFLVTRARKGKIQSKSHKLLEIDA